MAHAHPRRRPLAARQLARQACLQAAAESNEPARNLAATVAAVERLARRDCRLAVATETELGARRMTRDTAAVAGGRFEVG
jgi:predicted amidohydrolase